MCTQHDLQRLAEYVNARLDVLPISPDKLFLAGLVVAGIDEAELGEAFETDMGDWYWMPFKDVCLIQYRSGRLAVIGG